MEVKHYLLTTLLIASGVGGGSGNIARSPEFDAASGRIPGVTVVHKFGRNDAVGASAEDVWTGGGVYAGWLTSAIAVRVQAGGNAADDQDGGAGCRSVTIEGLDENWDVASETENTEGADVGTATTTTFIRVNRAYCASTGTYGVANTGNIVIETTGSTVVARIEAGKGQTEMTMYTCPASRTCYIVGYEFSVENSNSSSIEFYRRTDADDATVPFSPKRILTAASDVTGAHHVDIHSPIPIAAKTDLWWEATKITGGGDSQVAIAYDIWVKEDI